MGKAEILALALILAVAVFGFILAGIPLQLLYLASAGTQVAVAPVPHTATAKPKPPFGPTVKVGNLTLTWNASRKCYYAEARLSDCAYAEVEVRVWRKANVPGYFSELIVRVHVDTARYKEVWLEENERFRFLERAIYMGALPKALEAFRRENRTAVFEMEATVKAAVGEAYGLGRLVHPARVYIDVPLAPVALSDTAHRLGPFNPSLEYPTMVKHVLVPTLKLLANMSLPDPKLTYRQRLMMLARDLARSLHYNASVPACTYEELLVRGGVCYCYAGLGMTLGELLGFKVVGVDLVTPSYPPHAAAFIAEEDYPLKDKVPSVNVTEVDVVSYTDPFGNETGVYVLSKPIKAWLWIDTGFITGCEEALRALKEGHYKAWLGVNIDLAKPEVMEWVKEHVVKKIG